MANVKDEFRAPVCYIVMTVSAIVAGFLTGFERELKEKPAGVSLGSALFTMNSFIFTTSTGDSGRVAAQIVAGIGFLGASAVLKRTHDHITGLTTAADIWLTAAIGMLIGAGFCAAGIVFALCTVATLHLISNAERWTLKPCRFRPATIEFDVNGGKTYLELEEILDQVPSAILWGGKANPGGYDGHSERASYPSEEGAGGTMAGPDGRRTLRLNYCSTHRVHRAFLWRLADLGAVKRMSRGETVDNDDETHGLISVGRRSSLFS